MTFTGLKNHPFDVDARFDFSLVLTYALPVATLAPLLPAPLTLDTFDDHTGARWAFVAIAMVHRPQADSEAGRVQLPIVLELRPCALCEVAGQGMLSQLGVVRVSRVSLQQPLDAR